MLREIPHAALADKRRRWYQDDELDLTVWLSDAESIVGFQLCYRSAQSEWALSWTADGGYSHNRVDPGDDTPLRNDTPILVADGVFPTTELTHQFEERSRDIDPTIREFVVEKIRACLGKS